MHGRTNTGKKYLEGRAQGELKWKDGYRGGLPGKTGARELCIPGSTGMGEVNPEG
jgi:hypothetical protein